MYVAVFTGLFIYLYLLGYKPWYYLFDNFNIFIVVSTMSGIAIFVQAASFREVQPLGTKKLSWIKLTKIWSFSGVVSVIAPVFAGLATRTTLLVNEGMSLSVCVAASARQIWMGVEYALLLGGVAGFFVGLPRVQFFATLFIVGGGGMVSLRLYSARLQLKPHVKTLRWIETFSVPVLARAHPWFIVQLGAMAVIYYVAFNGLGATMALHEAILLASITILASLIVLIPNGLGIMDVIWVAVARESGLGLEQSVSLAIIIRLAYLVSALVVWVVILAVKKIMYRNSE